MTLSFVEIMNEVPSFADIFAMMLVIGLMCTKIIMLGFAVGTTIAFTLACFDKCFGTQSLARATRHVAHDPVSSKENETVPEC